MNCLIVQVIVNIGVYCLCYSLRLSPDWCVRKDLQPDERAVPLQGRRHWDHMQQMRQRISAVKVTYRTVHQ